jgi:hypothetical protein
VPEIMIVADSHDRFASQFGDDARTAGWGVARVSYTEASQLLSVSRRGETAVVDPSLPMLLRLPWAPNPWADSERQFHRAEICSLVWAAAALNAAPVINRPDAFGFTSRSSLTASVAYWRAEHGHREAETFASHVPEPAGPADQWWVERQTDRLTMPWKNWGSGRGPYRAGRVIPESTLATVATVAGEAFMDESPHPEADIAARSVRITRALGLVFAVVTWRLSHEDGAAEFVRINPHPSLREIGGMWRPVVGHLLQELRA